MTSAKLFKREKQRYNLYTEREILMNHMNKRQQVTLEDNKTFKQTY